MIAIEEVCLRQVMGSLFKGVVYLRTRKRFKAWWCGRLRPHTQLLFYFSLLYICGEKEINLLRNGTPTSWGNTSTGFGGETMGWGRDGAFWIIRIGMTGMSSDMIIWSTFKSKWWTKISSGFIPGGSENDPKIIRFSKLWTYFCFESGENGWLVLRIS